jgi:hypothetical protein
LNKLQKAIARNTKHMVKYSPQDSSFKRFRHAKRFTQFMFRGDTGKEILLKKVVHRIYHNRRTITFTYVCPNYARNVPF